MPLKFQIPELNGTGAQLAYAGLRSFLGVALFIRGVQFVADPAVVVEMLKNTGWDHGPTTFVAHYVGFAHLAGGPLLAVGLTTRIVSMIQVPILLGAIFFVHWGEGLGPAVQSMQLAILVLFMLVISSIFGGEYYSLDGMLDRASKTQQLVVTHHPGHAVMRHPNFEGHQGADEPYEA